MNERLQMWKKKKERKTTDTKEKKKETLQIRKKKKERKITDTKKKDHRYERKKEKVKEISFPGWMKKRGWFRKEGGDTIFYRLLSVQ